MAGIVNKVKEALSSDKSHEAPQGSTGPHGSKVANTADPRVDSDRDHRAKYVALTTDRRLSFFRLTQSTAQQPAPTWVATTTPPARTPRTVTTLAPLAPLALLAPLAPLATHTTM